VTRFESEAEGKTMPRFSCILLVLLCLPLLNPSANAQTDRATLEGTLTDPTGGAISGAKVQVLAVSTGISDEKRTNSNGYYRFPGLAVGEYRVTVTNTSFKTRIVDGVILEVGQTH
jgi:hypothetical protein